MVSKLTILGSVLLASTALAAQSSQLRARNARRHASRQSGLVNRDDNVEYNELWSGAIWDETNGDFTTITGTFTVPTVKPGPDAVASAWVGIDGRGRSPGLLQAGVNFWISNGEPLYIAWYEWYPEYANSNFDLPVHPGDVIKVTLNASSTTAGNVLLENLTTKKDFGISLTYPQYPLALGSVEWIVEDFQADNDPPVPLVDFGSVTFTDATASGPSGKVYTPSGAIIAEIQQSGTTLTSTTTEGSGLTVDHI